MIVTLKVTLGTHWGAEIEISELSTLQELHVAIQDSVGFDDDHLYEFYIARTERSRDRKVLDDENGELYDTSIRDLYPLPPRHFLFYLFDYGDNWLFKISKTRKAAHKADEGVEYPRVVKESGQRPVQYERYDEDDYEDENESQDETEDKRDDKL